MVNYSPTYCHYKTCKTHVLTFNSPLYHNLDSPDWDGEDLIRKEEIYILMLMKMEKYQIIWNQNQQFMFI